MHWFPAARYSHLGALRASRLRRLHLNVGDDLQVASASTLNVTRDSQLTAAECFLTGGTLNLSSGGDAIFGSTSFGGSGGAATVTVSGAGSTLNGPVQIDEGTLAITSGGSVSSATGKIAIGPQNAAVSVTGANSLWSIAGTLQMSGGDGSSTLDITGGTVTLGGNIIGGGAGISTLTLDGGTLDMQNHAIGQAGTTIDILNFRSGTLRNVQQINNSAGLTKTTAGTLTLDGTTPYTGMTTVDAGTLVIPSGVSLSSGCEIAPTVGSNAIVSVSGQWNMPNFTIGLAGTGTMNITAGGQVQSDRWRCQVWRQSG